MKTWPVSVAILHSGQDRFWRFRHRNYLITTLDLGGTFLPAISAAE